MTTRKCKTYGWTEDNIKIGEKMAGHISHHINNPLSVLMCKVNKLEGRDKEVALEQVDKITEYVKWVVALACEDGVCLGKKIEGITEEQAKAVMSEYWEDLWEFSIPELEHWRNQIIETVLDAKMIGIPDRSGPLYAEAINYVIQQRRKTPIYAEAIDYFIKHGGMKKGVAA